MVPGVHSNGRPVSASPTEGEKKRHASWPEDEDYRQGRPGVNGFRGNFVRSHQTPQNKRVPPDRRSRRLPFSAPTPVSWLWGR
jgi:hypothetical protein